MKFNKIVKISFVLALCAAVAPAQGMWDGTKKLVKDHPVAAASIAITPLVLWGGYTLWNSLSPKIELQSSQANTSSSQEVKVSDDDVKALWWKTLEESIKKGSLKEVRMLLNNQPGSKPSTFWNGIRLSTDGPEDRPAVFVRLIYRYRSVTAAKRIIKLFCTYKLIDVDQDWQCYSIIEQAMLFHNLDFIAYLYHDLGMKNIWTHGGKFYGAGNPIYFVLNTSSLTKDQKYSLFEFLMERVPRYIEAQWFNPPKDYYNHMIHFFGAMLKDMPKSTRSLELSLERVTRNNMDMLGGYAAYIMKLEDATVKQEMLATLGRVIRHEYNNAHFQEHVQTSLSVARKKQQYSDAVFCFESE